MLKTIRNTSKGLLFALGSIIGMWSVLGYCSKPMSDSEESGEHLTRTAQTWQNQEEYEFAKNYPLEEHLRRLAEEEDELEHYIKSHPDPIEIARHTWMCKDNDKMMWHSAMNGNYDTAKIMAIVRSDGSLGDMAVYYFLEAYCQYKKGNIDLLLQTMKDWEECTIKYPYLRR